MRLSRRVIESPSIVKSVLALSRFPLSRVTTLSSALCSLMLLCASPAAAHAILMDGTPKLNDTIAGPHIVFNLRYNSRLDQKRSRLTLKEPGGSKVLVAIKPDSPVDRLQAESDLAPGAYTLRWQVLATDGHITRGDVPFTVTAPAEAPSQSAPQPVAPGATAIGPTDAAKPSMPPAPGP